MMLSLSARAILVGVVLIATAPVIGVLLESAFSDEKEAVELATQRLVSRAQLRASSQEQLLGGLRNMLRAVAHAADVPKEPRACERHLKRLKQVFPEYSRFGFADASGLVECTSEDLETALSVADRAYFRRAVETGRFAAGEFFVSRVVDRPAIAFGLPAYRPDTQLHGVFYTLLELSRVQEQLAAAAVPGVTDIITDTAGTVLASVGERSQAVGQRLASDLWLRIGPAAGSRSGSVRSADGRLWLYAAERVEAAGGGGLIVLSVQSRAAVQDPVARRLRLQLALLLLIVAAASGLAWLVGDRLLVAPIQRLLLKVRALAAPGGGDQGPAPLAAPAVKELKRIDDCIDEAAAALAANSRQRDAAMAEVERKKESLAQSEQRYRAQFEASPQPMWVFDVDSLRFLAVNDAAIAQYGYSRDEFLQMTLADIRPAEDLPALAAIRQIRDSLGGHHETSTRHRRKNGDEIHVQVITHALRWNGQAARTAIVYDLTSQVLAAKAWKDLQSTLEHQVEQRTRDLQAAYEELDAFSYSVSHDLRGPVYVVDSFCQALLNRHAASLAPEAKHYVERIRAGAQHIYALIDSLLALSKAASEPIAAQELDLAELADAVVRRLRERSPARQVQVEIERPLRAVGDRALLGIVLENLIGNSWKFTGGIPDAVIRLGLVEATDSETVYCVSDNGAGFDQAYAQRLFEPFQRLHSATEFEGTGIGLAIVARIVRRHGGHVWAGSERGKGARVSFALPN